MNSHFTITFWIPVKPFATSQAPLKRCDRPRLDVSMRELIRIGPFWTFLVNCDLINNSNSIGIKLESYHVRLCHLLLEYFIITYLFLNAIFKLNSKTSLPGICLYDFFFLFWWEGLCLEVCISIFDTSCTHNWSSFWQMWRRLINLSCEHCVSIFYAARRRTRLREIYFFICNLNAPSCRRQDSV